MATFQTNRPGQTAGCKRIAAALGAITAILVLGVAPSAIAKIAQSPIAKRKKPVTVPVQQALSVVKAPDGTITARLVLTAKDPACLSAIPWAPGFPILWLKFPGDTQISSFPHSFPMPVVGPAANQVIVPPDTSVTVDVGDAPTGGRDYKQFTTSQATAGKVFVLFAPNRPWKRKSKKLGRVICLSKVFGGEFPL